MTDLQQPSELRAACRSGDFTGNTSGLAPGYVQCNIVILPADWAGDFLRFCQANDWPDAVAPDVLQGFAANLQEDHRQTLQRFLALQVTGEPQARQTLRELKQRVFEQDEPETIALQSGLNILSTADLRPLAGDLNLPVLLIGGAKDRLVSPQALDNVAALLSVAKVEVMPDCGHAPFISQPKNFMKLVKTFCNHVD